MPMRLETMINQPKGHGSDKSRRETLDATRHMMLTALVLPVTLFSGNVIQKTEVEP